jgi:hypothetical protein
MAWEARSNPSKLEKIRATPPIGPSFGSSGWSASRTPASSATGTARSANHWWFSHICSAEISRPK